MVANTLIDAISEVEHTIGVAAGFFPKLVTDGTDDWSYVIKLHALVEAALTHLLTTSDDMPEMASVYALLDTSDMRKGKLAFARKLELLNKDQCKFVIALSEIRNDFVHDVKNAGMALDQYYEAMDANQKKSFVEAISNGRPQDWTINIQGSEIPLRKFIGENIKLGIWLGALDLLSSIYLQRERLLIRNDYSRLHMDLLKQGKTIEGLGALVLKALEAQTPEPSAK